MSSAYLIPFNFQPVNTVVGSSGTYTVPANMYAYATITLNSTVGVGSFTGNNVSGASRTINILSINSGSRVCHVFLKAGDVLSFSTLSASGVTSTPTSFGGGTGVTHIVSHNDTARQSALVNSSIFSSAVSSLFIDATYTGTATSSPQTFTQNISTTTSFSFIISEYNVIGA